MALSDSSADPDYPRASFIETDFDNAVVAIRKRFPNIAPLYLTKIFRGTIKPAGLVWLDVDRQDATPADFEDLGHLLYCFEIYGQIVCLFAADNNDMVEVQKLQCALADYRIRLLGLAKNATFESLRAWHAAFLEKRFYYGQDSSGGWRERNEELRQLLRQRK